MKMLLLAAVMTAVAVPAMAGHDDKYPRRDHDDLEEMIRGVGGGHEGFRPRGAAFFLRSGDSMVAVRCDPRDPIRDCMDATMTLLEKARSLQQGSGSGTPSTPPGKTP